ncbi:NAD(P)/FAD-dependent oxidoreductase [Microbacterium sp. SD291]|uniref:flavin monoamine oxidase family protein n=1 Tax=Microbacterium sp. SD291 TaxID=2782007 RepID=UPI001A960F1D|nr:NAD(P)/FAD-dependent oxidoreductase [Microbacterium sp. SD291]MBO0981827.1 FAD-dependent oxidoreductase [Microbacterium sp. SD291]
MTAQDYDVIVVGAGFAGLAAARELTWSGRRVLILEARDRIGGRTWLDRRLGLDIELGGTWVHWTQPYVWAELHRYGLGLVPSPEPVTAWRQVGGRPAPIEPDALLDLLDAPNRELGRVAREVFPQPFSPLGSEQGAELDDVLLIDRLDALGLDDERSALLRSFWTLNFNGRLDDAAFTQALRWLAVANGDWQVMFEACASYKIAGGTRALAEAILSDTDAELRLNADVVSITDRPGEVAVELGDGSTVTAASVIVTTPLHALTRIRFDPELPIDAAHAVDRGQVGLGTKLWFSVEGEHPHFVAFGDADAPLNFLQSEYHVDGRTIVIGFGPDAGAIDGGDLAAVQQAVDRLVPGLTIVEVAGHDWTADPLSGETWPMHRAGYLSRGLPALRAPHGRVVFAGSDVADGWGGFIDGAIESGVSAARGVLQGAVIEVVPRP